MGARGFTLQCMNKLIHTVCRAFRQPQRGCFHLSFMPEVRVVAEELTKLTRFQFGHCDSGFVPKHTSVHNDVALEVS